MFDGRQGTIDIFKMMLEHCGQYTEERMNKFLMYLKGVDIMIADMRLAYKGNPEKFNELMIAFSEDVGKEINNKIEMYRSLETKVEDVIHDEPLNKKSDMVSHGHESKQTKGKFITKDDIMNLKISVEGGVDEFIRNM